MCNWNKSFKQRYIYILHTNFLISTFVSNTSTLVFTTIPSKHLIKNWSYTAYSNTYNKWTRNNSLNTHKTSWLIYYMPCNSFLLQLHYYKNWTIIDICHILAHNHNYPYHESPWWTNCFVQSSFFYQPKPFLFFHTSLQSPISLSKLGKHSRFFSCFSYIVVLWPTPELYIIHQWNYAALLLSLLRQALVHVQSELQTNLSNRWRNAFIWISSTFLRVSFHYTCYSSTIATRLAFSPNFL